MAKKFFEKTSRNPRLGSAGVSMIALVTISSTDALLTNHERLQSPLRFWISKIWHHTIRTNYILNLGYIWDQWWIHLFGLNSFDFKILCANWFGILLFNCQQFVWNECILRCSFVSLQFMLARTSKLHIFHKHSVNFNFLSSGRFQFISFGKHTLGCADWSRFS